jgi:hypothetical protein
MSSHSISSVSGQATIQIVGCFVMQTLKFANYSTEIPNSSLLWVRLWRVSRLLSPTQLWLSGRDTARWSLWIRKGRKSERATNWLVHTPSEGVLPYCGLSMSQVKGSRCLHGQ